MMNREKRREMRTRAAKRVKAAKSYVLLTFDGNGEPIYSFDVESCSNRDDIRHAIMRKAAVEIERNCTILRQVVERKMQEAEQDAKVSEALVKRSADLAGEAADDSEPINGSAVPELVPAGVVAEEEKAE